MVVVPHRRKKNLYRASMYCTHIQRYDFSLIHRLYVIRRRFVQQKRVRTLAHLFSKPSKLVERSIDDDSVTIRILTRTELRSVEDDQQRTTKNFYFFFSSFSIHQLRIENKEMFYWLRIKRKRKHILVKSEFQEHFRKLCESFFFWIKKDN